MTGPRKCYRCGGPTPGGPCPKCSRLIELESRSIPRPSLPPREPIPPSLPFCNSCGALRTVVPFRGVAKCAECWRKSA